ncbi:hypothetical protein Bbelb_099570 [Branchiostoma belcheri]|nr:hypothetical protein Bbelb_099570 [Branchiostoma belcheri]
MHLSTCPPDLKKMLSKPYTIRRTTRSSLSTGKHALTVPVSRTHATGRTFIHTAVDIWNSLPDNVVGRITDNNLQSFKTRIAIRATSPGGSLESRTNSNRIDNRYICTDRERSRFERRGQRPWVSEATGDAKEIALSSRRCGYQAIDVTQMSGASRRSSCAVWNSAQLQRLIRSAAISSFTVLQFTTTPRVYTGSTTVEQKLDVSGTKLFNFWPSLGIPGRLINKRNSKL